MTRLELAERNVLLTLALELHTRLFFDNAPFSLTAFAHDMSEATMVLGEIHLETYRESITTALLNHPTRQIAPMQAQQIFSHLSDFQTLIRTVRTQEKEA